MSRENILSERKPTRGIYFVQIGASAVYVKEGEFFIDQGGLKEKWGETWVPVQAVSIEDARKKGEAMRQRK